MPHGHSNAAAVGVKPNCVQGFGAGVSPSARSWSSTAGTSIVSQLMSSAVGSAALDVGLTDGLGEGASVAGPGKVAAGVGGGADESWVQAAKPAAPQTSRTVAQSQRKVITLATYRTAVLRERAGVPRTGSSSGGEPVPERAGHRGVRVPVHLRTPMSFTVAGKQYVHPPPEVCTISWRDGVPVRRALYETAHALGAPELPRSTSRLDM